MSERGQVFTLEGVVAAILLLATLVFALQAVGISANTGSGGDTELQQQHVGLTEGTLNEAVDNGTLKTTLLYWNPSEGAFHGADDQDDGFYISRSPPNETVVGEAMETLFDDRQVRYNVNLYYRDGDGNREMQRLVEYGTPNDEAVRVVETVTLYEHDRLYNSSGVATNQTLADLDDDEFYAPPVDEPGLYNVVRVEVVLWQS